MSIIFHEQSTLSFWNIKDITFVSHVCNCEVCDEYSDLQQRHAVI